MGSVMGSLHLETCVRCTGWVWSPIPEMILVTGLLLFSSCLPSGYFPFPWGFSEKVTHPLQNIILLLNGNDGLFLWLTTRSNWLGRKEGARPRSWPRPEGKSRLL